MRLRAPIWPAIFLFLKTRPGSWRLPVEPCERCETETPWVARRPLKPQRFIAPAKPLPWVHALDVDQLAGDEMVGGELGADVEQRVLGDAELDQLRLGLDLGLAEMAALRLGQVLGLGRAGAELDGGIAVALRLAAADDLDIVERQDGDRHVPAVFLEQAGHPHFLRDHASAHDQTPHDRGPAGPSRGRVQARKTMRAPPGLMLPPKAERRGTQAGSMLPRYPLSGAAQPFSWIPASPGLRSLRRA